MARRRSTRRRRVTRTATRYVRSRGSRSALQGAIKPIAAGAITGVIQSIIPDNLFGGYADKAAPIAVGYFMNDKTLMTIGGYQLGVQLASGMTGAKGSTLGGGAY